jgi:hypothetical protein
LIQHASACGLAFSTPASRACQHAPANASACQHASGLRPSLVSTAPLAPCQLLRCLLAWCGIDYFEYCCTETCVVPPDATGTLFHPEGSIVVRVSFYPSTRPAAMLASLVQGFPQVQTRKRALGTPRSGDRPQSVLVGQLLHPVFPLHRPANAEVPDRQHVRSTEVEHQGPYRSSPRRPSAARRAARVSVAN